MYDAIKLILNALHHSYIKQKEIRRKRRMELERQRERGIERPYNNHFYLEWCFIPYAPLYTWSVAWLWFPSIPILHKYIHKRSHKKKLCTTHGLPVPLLLLIIIPLCLCPSRFLYVNGNSALHYPSGNKFNVRIASISHNNNNKYIQLFFRVISFCLPYSRIHQR